MPHYLHSARKGEASLYSIMSPEAYRPMCIELKRPMLFLFFFSLRQRMAWTLIRKTQSHIITLDETKEDNPVVHLGYFIIELNYSSLLTYHGALAFRSGHAICIQPFFQADDLKWAYESEGPLPDQMCEALAMQRLPMVYPRFDNVWQHC